MEDPMKLLAITSIALGLAGAAWADPSESGLEHRNSEFNPTRTGWENKHSVPDAGGTLGLLSLGMASLAFWRLKVA
jgi:hypothetical protein